MSILYPIDKPVTAEDIRAKATELLQREGEWTAWERDVLTLVAGGAEAIHSHYMRHVWFETEEAQEPDLQAARDEVMLAVERALQMVGPEHAPETLILIEDVLSHGEISAGDALSALLLHAASIVDDLVLSLRRGAVAIEDNGLHGVSVDSWSDILAFSDEDVRLPGAQNALDVLASALDALADEEDGEGEARAAVARRVAAQTERNTKRVTDAVALTNENYGLPAGFALRISDLTPQRLILQWGPTDTAPEGMEEVRTRPSGRDAIRLQPTSLGEVHPRAIADIARSGRFAGLSVGRDAEIRSTGTTLSEPPIWAWAGPLPLVRHVLARLRAGEDVDVTRDGMSAGPILSAERIELGDGAAVYAYSARTLDESLTLDQQIPDTLAHACIGNPLSVLIQAPMFDDERITIQACDVGENGTDLDLLSPLVRLIPAPAGYEQDPETAWLGMLKDFDEHAVYGDRIYRRSEAVMNGQIRT